MRNAALLLIPLFFLACGGGDPEENPNAAAPPAPTAPTAPAPASTPPPAAATPPASQPPSTPDTNPSAAPDAEEGSRYFYDEGIPAAVRDFIRAEQTRVVDGLRNNDLSALEAAFVPSQLPQSAADTRTFFDRLRTGVEGAQIAPWHEFYIEPKSTNPVLIETPDGVRVAMPSIGPGVYMMLQQLNAGFRDGLLSSIWVKRPEGWRLVSLHLGALRLNGKTAVNWYEEADALAKDGRRLPAWLRLTVADDLLDSVPFVGYAHANVARRLQGELATALTEQHGFPLPLPTVANEPQVVRIDPTFLQGSLSPVVHYVTKLNLQDSSLGEEAQAVADALAELYEGFCHDATNVALVAYEEVPSDPRRDYASVAFVANCP